MRSQFTYLAILLIYLAGQRSFSQTSVVPKLVPDGPINELEYSPSLGLIMAGNFKYVGYPARNIAIVDNNSGNPSGRFPFVTVTNNAVGREVVPDGAGGWYVITNSQLYSYGSFIRRPQQMWSDSTGRLRIFDCITHLNADNSIDTIFKINANTSTYRIINVQRVVLHKSRLYAWCDLADQAGDLYRRQLLGINARTGAVEWNPQTGHRLDVETGDLSILGRQLFVVGRMNIVNGQPTTRYSLSYNLDTHQTTNWNPLSSIDFECSGCGVTSVEGKENRLVMTAGVPPNASKEFIATDTVANILWRQRPEGFSSSNTFMTIDNTVGYYQSSYYGSNIIKIRLSDGQIVRRHTYAEFRQTTDTVKLNIGDIRGLSLQGRHLYIYGSSNDGMTVRRSAVQVDTATFRPTDWKPFNEREAGESDYAGNYRSIGNIAFQGNKVFMAGDFTLAKIQFAPNLAALDPITGTLRWRPRVNLQQENYLQQIQAIAADGDSLIWIYQHNTTLKALDARTGFKVKSFDLSSSGNYVAIKQIIPASDRLYLQGQFYQIRGIATMNGFAAITKDGGVFPWEPVFSNNTGGRVNKIALQGDQIYLGGQFTTYNGSKHLAIINRFTGAQTNWKADMPNSRSGYDYEVKDFVVQGNEILTVWQNGGPPPGEYRKVSLSTGKVTATYSYTTCGTSDQLLAKDKYIFVNENYCLPYGRDNLSYFDQISKKFANKPLLTKCSIQPPGDYSARDYIPNPKDMLFVGNKLYYALNYDDDPYGTILPFPKLMALNFPRGFLAETVEYFPKSGGNAGNVTVNFYGYNLAVGTKVKLTRAGQTSIVVPDSLVKFPELSRMEVVFNLSGKAVGAWDIEIFAPMGERIVISNGFAINQGKPADIRIMINAPTAYRVGGPIKLTISVANRGNTDAYMVPIWIRVSKDVKLYSDVNAYMDSVRVRLDSLGLFPIFVGGSGGGGGSSDNGAGIMIPKVGGGETTDIPITALPVRPEPVTVSATPGKPLRSSPPPLEEDFLLDYGYFNDVKDCIRPIVDNAFEDLVKIIVPPDIGEARDCIVDGFSFALLFTYIRPEKIDITSSFMKTALECLQAVGGKKFEVAQEFLEAFSDSIDLANAQNEKKEGDEGCDGLRPIPPTSPNSPNNPKTLPSEPATILPVQAIDPNDKLGPVGIKHERFVNSDNPFNYVIRFENYASATAAAQIVRVLDTLDRTKYDYNTFQLGFFNVADTTFYVPPGRKQYSVDWDLRPAKKLVLRMEARFNDTTGVLTSTYTALDPVTMELTEDVFVGFLPPNKKAPEGEGSLAFSIRTRDSLPNLAQVKNTAHIYFDYNAPIPTPVWTNTLDKGIPQSTMKSLATISRSTTLTLGWRGTDAESGPKLYDVFVSVNGGSYKPLLTATQDSTIQFVGKADSTYRFYSVAYDGVYNQELAPLTFDTETTIRLNTGVIESLRSGNWNDPATWSCGCIPTEASDVIIKATHVIKLDSTMPEAVCRNLELLGTFSMQGSSILVNGVRITIDQDSVRTK